MGSVIVQKPVRQIFCDDCRQRTDHYIETCIMCSKDLCAKCASHWRGDSYCGKCSQLANKYRLKATDALKNILEEHRLEREAKICGVLGLAALTLASCEETCYTSPTSPPVEPPYTPIPETTTTTIPEKPPILDFEPEFPIRCVTAFALGLRNEMEIMHFCDSTREHGYNMVRVGSETADWSGGGFFGNLQGPEPGLQEWEDNLLRVVETCGRVGMPIELCVIFTVKGRDFNWQLDYARKVADLVKQYRHVMFSAVNEPIHDTSILNVRKTNKLLKTLYPYGKLLTVDAGGPPWDWPFDRHRVNFVAYHPRRNPEPSKRELRDAMSKHGQIFFDETTCWLADDDSAYGEMIQRGTVAQGTEQERKNQVEKHLNDIAEVGGDLCYHAVRLMAGQPEFWYPRIQ